MSKSTWTKQSCFHYFCWYILLSSIVNVGLIAVFIWENYELRLTENFDGTIVTILSVLGVFIAFTAINIYSVFNVRVEDEKQKLKEVREKCYGEMAGLEKKILDLKKEFTNFEEKINKNLVGIDDYNLKDDIFDIKNSDVVLEKVHAIYALMGRIETIKTNINKTDSISEKRILEEDLLKLKYKIKENLKPHYEKIEKIEGETFIGIFNNFKALLDEVVGPEKIENNSEKPSEFKGTDIHNEPHIAKATVSQRLKRLKKAILGFIFSVKRWKKR